MVKPEKCPRRRLPSGFIGSDPRTRLQAESSSGLHQYLCAVYLNRTAEIESCSAGGGEELRRGESGAIGWIYKSGPFGTVNLPGSYGIELLRFLENEVTMIPRGISGWREVNGGKDGNYTVGRRVVWAGKGCGVR